MSKCVIAKEKLIEEMKKKEKIEKIDLCILREKVAAIPCDILEKIPSKARKKRQPSAYNLHIKKCVGEEKKKFMTCVEEWRGKKTKSVKSNIEYDLIQEIKRQVKEDPLRGGMIRLPDLKHSLDQYSSEEINKELFRLEKERKLEMQTASDPKVLKEPELAIRHPTRGHINYVMIRR